MGKKLVIFQDFVNFKASKCDIICMEMTLFV